MLVVATAFDELYAVPVDHPTSPQAGDVDAGSVAAGVVIDLAAPP